MQFDSLLDRIVVRFTAPQFSENVQEARRVFFENAGVLDETAQDFDQRMALFLDWYTFTRELDGYGQPPIVAVLSDRDFRLSEEETEQINHLQQARHSLFEYIKIKKDRIYLKDLIRNEKILVEKTPSVVGFHSDEIFEARIVPVGETYFFLKGFCFHPFDAKKFILKEVKQLRKDRDRDPERAVLRLMKMKYRFEQYKHVKFDAIYNNDIESKVRT